MNDKLIKTSFNKKEITVEKASMINTKHGHEATIFRVVECEAFPTLVGALFTRTEFTNGMTLRHNARRCVNKWIPATPDSRASAITFRAKLEELKEATEAARRELENSI